MEVKEKAEKIFTQKWFSSMAKFSDIFAVRQVGQIASKTTDSAILSHWHKFTYDLKTSTDRGPFRSNEMKDEFFKKVGGVYSFSQQMKNNQLHNFQNTIDATSLIFAHSILDDSAYECCRITLILSPDFWISSIKNRKVKLEYLHSNSSENIIKEKCDEYFIQFEKESLLSKIDRLFNICKPEKDYDPLENYKYDREKIKYYDDLRHQIVHKEIPKTCFKNGDAEINYLFKTNFLFFALINNHYDLKINPLYLQKSD